MRTIEKQNYLKNLEVRRDINKSFFYLYLNKILNSYQISVLARTSEVPKELHSIAYKIYATRALHVSKKAGGDSFTPFFNKSGKFIFSTDDVNVFKAYLTFSAPSSILVVKFRINEINYFLTKFDYDDLTRSNDQNSLSLLSSIVSLSSNVVDTAFGVVDNFFAPISGADETKHGLVSE